MSTLTIGERMSGQPTSVTRAVQLLWGLVALGGLVAVLCAVFRDEVLDAWASGHPIASGVDDSVTPPAFVPVAIVLFLVLAGLVWILLVFLRGGQNWARLSLVVMVLGIAIATFALMRRGLPSFLIVLCWVSFVVDALAVWFLVHRDTSAYIRHTERVEHTSV
jgi:O-antigen/teichoic acid export membrane protein